MNKIVKFISLMIAGCIFVVLASLVFTNTAQADRDRESTRDKFEYIGNAGNCSVYYTRHNNSDVFVSWGYHCTVSSN